MASRFPLQGRTAVVTGAAGGIGAAIAASLAGHGCNLALVDVDTAGLDRLAAELAPAGVRITTHVADMADAEAIAALPQAVEAAHGGADLLVNNAGAALGGTFEEVDPADFDWLFSINVFGVVRMTRAFLPLLHRSGDAWIANLSSIFGIVAFPGQAAYTASKFAVRGFSESLRHELEGSTVGVSVVHPGGVRTSIAASSRPPRSADPDEVAREKKRFEKHLRMPPEEAGRIIVEGIRSRKARILVGKDARQLALIERLFPVSYWQRVRRRMAA